MSQKPYQLTLELRPEYAFGHVIAPFTSKEIAFGFLTEAADFCRQNERDRLLFLREIPDMTSDTTIYYMGEEFARLMMDIKLAVVNPFPKLENSLQFVETVGANRGARNKLFSNISEAEEWLLS